MKIREATEADSDAIWNIFHEVVAVGDTYALDPHLSREEALGYWFAADTQTYVARGIAGRRASKEVPYSYSSSRYRGHLHFAA